MMRGLVAVHILPDGAHNTDILWRSDNRTHFKKSIQFLGELFGTSEQVYQSRNVVLNRPYILPCVGFGIIAVWTAPNKKRVKIAVVGVVAVSCNFLLLSVNFF